MHVEPVETSSNPTFYRMTFKTQAFRETNLLIPHFERNNNNKEADIFVCINNKYLDFK